MAHNEFPPYQFVDFALRQVPPAPRAEQVEPLGAVGSVDRLFVPG
jgi:hypothetical protein